MDPTYDRAKAGRPARTYIQQLCEDIYSNWCLKNTLHFRHGRVTSLDPCHHSDLVASILGATSSLSCYRYPTIRYVELAFLSVARFFDNWSISTLLTFAYEATMKWPIKVWTYSTTNPLTDRKHFSDSAKFINYVLKWFHKPLRYIIFPYY